MNPAWLGILLAGCLSGSFAIPAKKVRRLAWDQTWLIYCVVALVLIPAGLAVGFAPVLFQAVFPAHPVAVMLVAACGVGWGIGALLFAVSIPRLGFSLAYAIVCGAVTLVGSVGPLVLGTAKIGPGEGGQLAAGLGLLIVAIGVSSWASILRDRAAATAEKAAPTLTDSLIGVTVAIVAGALSAMLNIAFAYGGPMIAQATASGVPPVAASMAVWLPALSGGFVINATATAWKIHCGEGWQGYLEAPASDWFRSASLGFLWLGGIVTYSVVSPALGQAGTVYGWAVNGGISILVSAAWGIRTGEWKHAHRNARLWALAGVALFLAAFAILAAAG